ncbi:MAG: ribosome biogenesis GTPase Der [Deltaproteobacteria bacterium]|nr:ribosome biogenesis GTPase Der [Deltaproteobacteria bacterium]
MKGHLPLVALVGRPNVGKSTLFNRLVGERAALVDDRPGVTRDRLFGECEHEGRVFRVVDTGGFEPRADDELWVSVREQTTLAIDEADLVLLVLDGAAGLQATDRDIAALLRRGAKKVVAVVNKIDTGAHEDRLADFYALGFESVLPVSAEHGREVGALCDLVVSVLDPPLASEADLLAAPLPVRAEEPEAAVSSVIEWQGGPVRVAVIGRPNVGKSSLVNALVGEKRLVESPVAGTTRDAVDSEVTIDGQPFVFIDTAGMRRKFSIAERLERFAVMVAVRSLDRADVTLVVLDATTGVTEQDAHIVGLANERGKGVLLVMNKWDLVETEERRHELKDAVRYRLPFVPYAPLFTTSAHTGKGVSQLLGAAVAAQRERHRRVPTAELNRFFAAVVDRHPPPIQNAKRPRLYFVTQPLIRPPTFVFAASRIEAIPEAYRRYLANALRERYGFEATPLWIKFRPHGGKNKRTGTYQSSKRPAAKR